MPRRVFDEVCRQLSAALLDDFPFTGSARIVKQDDCSGGKSILKHPRYSIASAACGAGRTIAKD